MISHSHYEVSIWPGERRPHYMLGERCRIPGSVPYIQWYGPFFTPEEAWQHAAVLEALYAGVPLRFAPPPGTPRDFGQVNYGPLVPIYY